MSRLFENAFARLGHAGSKQAEFALAWAGYIEAHPLEVALDQVADDTFEMTVRTREATPVSLLAFGDWLTALRSALDNALYAWAATLSGQDPPPDAGRLQFPIATTATDFGEQARRLRSLPADVVAKLEKAQPYHSAICQVEIKIIKKCWQQVNHKAGTADSNEITLSDSRAFCPISAVPAASDHDFSLTYGRLVHAAASAYCGIRRPVYALMHVGSLAMTSRGRPDERRLSPGDQVQHGHLSQPGCRQSPTWR